MSVSVSVGFFSKVGGCCCLFLKGDVVSNVFFFRFSLER